MVRRASVRKRRKREMRKESAEKKSSNKNRVGRKHRRRRREVSWREKLENGMEKNRGKIERKKAIKKLEGRKSESGIQRVKKIEKERRKRGISE